MAKVFPSKLLILSLVPILLFQGSFAGSSDAGFSDGEFSDNQGSSSSSSSSDATEDDVVIELNEDGMIVLPKVETCVRYEINPVRDYYLISVLAESNIKTVLLTDQVVECGESQFDEEDLCEEYRNATFCLFAHNLNSENQVNLQATPDTVLTQVNLYVILDSEEETGSVNIIFTPADLSITDACKGRAFDECTGANETVCDESCQWASCQVVLRNDLGSASIYENGCINATTLEADVEPTCESNFALFKVAPFSDAAHQDTTMDLVHVDLVPCGPNGGMGVLLIVGLVIIVLAIVLVGLVFACSCYYKSKLTSTNQAPFTPPSFCPDFLFPSPTLTGNNEPFVPK